MAIFDAYLLKAVDDNFIEGVTFLLNYGANPNRESFNALDLAIKKAIGIWSIPFQCYEQKLK